VAAIDASKNCNILEVRTQPETSAVNPFPHTAAIGIIEFMTELQVLFVLAFACICLAIFAASVLRIRRKDTIFGLTRSLFFIGSFVWGDAVVFSLFWLLVSILCFWLNNWYLFLLFHSVFWTVRAAGETLYWLNQQFSTLERNPPHTLIGFRFFRNDSIWFVYQIFWQCITVFGIIASIYCSWMWLASLT
jgi:hypothetical protein